jgi:hypothetical protein
MNPMATRIIVAVALIAVAVVTLTALKDSDRWRRPGRTSIRPANDPYEGLSHLLAAGPGVTDPVRDPFRPVSVASAPRIATVKVLPPAPVREMPVLTAIVSDAEPQAVIHYQDRNYTVGAGGLFADYQVVSVTADAVVLMRAGEQVVLQRPKKGE